MSNFNPFLDPPPGQPPGQGNPPPAPTQFGPPSSPSTPLNYASPFDAAPAPVQHQTHPQKKKPVGILAGIAAALAKFWSIVVTFLIKFKFLLIFLKTGGSMLLSMGFYIWRFRSVSLAIGFVLLIFVHEMGHVVAAKWKGLPVSAPLFIPGLGAAIMMKSMPSDALVEAEVGYGGPLFGAIGATVCWGLFFVTGMQLFAVLAYLTAFMNLFNLIPVSPLDGGRIVAAISPYVWLFGLVVMALWLFLSPNIIVLLALILGGNRLYHQWKLIGTSDYYRVSPQARLVMGVLYVGLILYLGAMSFAIGSAVPQLGFA